MKKLLIALIFVGILVLSPVHSTHAASDETKVLVGINEKIQLRTTFNKPSWGSSDTSIAKVSKTGKVTGKKPGKCIVAAVSKNKAEIFVVTVANDDSLDMQIEDLIKEKQVIEEKPEEANNNTSEEEPMITPEEHVFQVTYEMETPKAYVDGAELVYGQTTYEEFLKSLEFSEYSVENTIDKNKLTSWSFTVNILRNEARMASVSFYPTDSMIAKDCVVYDVEIFYNAPHDTFYYFDERYKVPNLPDFSTFRESNLFSKDFVWNRDAPGAPYYFDDNGDLLFANHQKECIVGVLFRIPGLKNYRYTLMLYFNADSEEHECTYLCFKHGFFGDYMP